MYCIGNCIGDCIGEIYGQSVRETATLAASTTILFIRVLIDHTASACEQYHHSIISNRLSAIKTPAWSVLKLLCMGHIDVTRVRQGHAAENNTGCLYYSCPSVKWLYQQQCAVSWVHLKFVNMQEFPTNTSIHSFTHPTAYTHCSDCTMAWTASIVNSTFTWLTW